MKKKKKKKTHSHTLSALAHAPFSLITRVYSSIHGAKYFLSLLLLDVPPSLLLLRYLVDFILRFAISSQF